MNLTIFFLALCVVFFFIIVIQRASVVISRRNLNLLQRNIGKEREATADIVTLSKKIISDSNIDDETFLQLFVEYALRTLKGIGGAVLKTGEDSYFYGCGIAGTFPPLREVSSQVEQQLMAHSKKHTEFFKGMKSKFTTTDIDEICGEKGYAFFNARCPIWFPEKFIREAPRILIAPLKVQSQILGCVIITSKNDFDSYRISESDGLYLLRIAEIASLSLEILKVFKERQEYEVRLQSAREEGMMQVSTGIIHNIGNAVTVAKLSVHELQEKLKIKREERPETLILEEIIPRMRKELDAATILDFLKSDQAGSQYFDIMTELLNHLNDKSDESAQQLDSLSNKLHHISEIIELQQRFVGELGTENLTHLSEVVESSIKIFEESFNKRGVKINTDFDPDVPEVLIDSSMMTQVIMNIVKNAVEAMDMENSPEKKYILDMMLVRDEREGREVAMLQISDNGPGIPEKIRDKIFNFGFSTKGRENSRGYGLHSCLDTIKKYGGGIELETEEGRGTCFKIYIPVGQKD